MKKNQDAITLIALIITIIVILVLTSIVISIATNNNGLINETNRAKQQMNFATVREHLQMKIVEYDMDKAIDLTYSKTIIEYLTTCNGVDRPVLTALQDGNSWKINVENLIGIRQSIGNGTTDDIYKIVKTTSDSNIIYNLSYYGKNDTEGNLIFAFDSEGNTINIANVPETTPTSIPTPTPTENVDEREDIDYLREYYIYSYHYDGESVPTKSTSDDESFDSDGVERYDIYDSNGEIKNEYRQFLFQSSYEDCWSNNGTIINGKKAFLLDGMYSHNKLAIIYNNKMYYITQDEWGYNYYEKEGYYLNYEIYESDYYEMGDGYYGIINDETTELYCINDHGNCKLYDGHGITTGNSLVINEFPSQFFDKLTDEEKDWLFYKSNYGPRSKVFFRDQIILYSNEFFTSYYDEQYEIDYDSDAMEQRRQALRDQFVNWAENLENYQHSTIYLKECYSIVDPSEPLQDFICTSDYYEVVDNVYWDTNLYVG